MFSHACKWSVFDWIQHVFLTHHSQMMMIWHHFFWTIVRILTWVSRNWPRGGVSEVSTAQRRGLQRTRQLRGPYSSTRGGPSSRAVEWAWPREKRSGWFVIDCLSLLADCCCLIVTRWLTGCWQLIVFLCECIVALPLLSCSLQGFQTGSFANCFRPIPNLFGGWWHWVVLSLQVSRRLATQTTWMKRLSRRSRLTKDLVNVLAMMVTKARLVSTKSVQLFRLMCVLDTVIVIKTRGDVIARQITLAMIALLETGWTQILEWSCE